MDNETVEHVVVRPNNDHKCRCWPSSSLQDNAEFERTVGDTSAFARVVHPPAVPMLSTERPHPPRPRTPKLSLPRSRLVQILLPHQRLDRTRNQPSLSLASPRLPGASNHSATDSETTLTDAAPPSGSGQFPPTHTYPPVPTPTRAGSAVSEHRPREARPARSCAPRDLLVRVVAPNPSCHRGGGAHPLGSVLESASCADSEE